MWSFLMMRGGEEMFFYGIINIVISRKFIKILMSFNKYQKNKVKKLSSKIAKAGFGHILRELNLTHILPFTQFRKHKEFSRDLPDAAALVRLLTDLGPGFIELARIAASRSDLVPQKYQNDLLNLSYQLQGLKRAHVDSVLRRELGRSKAKEFSHIDKIAHHINLLGSTHRAIMHDGARALVTVNYEHVAREFEKNLDQIEFLFDKALPNLESQKAIVWQNVIDELRSRAEIITDLTNAAAKEEILSEQFKESKKIIIPEVLWEYTTPNLLVQSHRNLPDWSDLAHRRATTASSKKYLVQYLLEAFAYQYGIGGHFLLRPRLSNWLVGEKNSIVFNNFLAIGYLEPQMRMLFIEFLRAVLESDAQRASKLLLKMHYESRDLEDHQSAGLVLRKIEGETVSEKIWYCLEHAWQGRLIVPLGISMAAESVLYLEHALKRFDPEIDLGDALLSAIKKM